MEQEVLTAEHAIEQAFGRNTEETRLISRLLMRATEASPSQGESVILLFTGYGPRLARRTHELWATGPFEGSRIWVLGPDSLPWKGNKDADAAEYRGWLIDLGISGDRIEADASAQTSFTPGQARIAARRAGEVGDVRNFALVTAGYHQPRAYMTLLRALQARDLNEKVNIYPRPLMPKDHDWGTTDLELDSEISWAAALRTDEAPKVFKYQMKGDVASWPTLDDHLRQIEAD